MKELEEKIKKLFLEYDKLYNPELTKSIDIEKYGENEFIGGEREAFQDILELIEGIKKV